MAKTRMRDLVIVLPGITGSVLADSAGKKTPVDIWAPSGQAIWQVLKSLGDSVRKLEVASHDPRQTPPDTGVMATRVIQSFHGVLGLGKIDGYTALTRLITDQFVMTRGRLDDEAPANFFEFPYDWRLSNRHSATQLRDFVDTRLSRWRTAPNGSPDAKLILIAHSMGGLVARYYLEVLDGWRECRALITFGTPYRGAVNAINYIANGYKESFLDLTAVLRSCPAVYELLPVYKALKENGTWRRVAEGPLPKAVADYVAAASEFHKSIKHAVDSHLNDTEYLKNRYRIFPFVGVAQPTLQSATLDGGVTLRASTDRPDWIDEALEGGDGTVPRVSATPIELSDQYRETFFGERHAALQNNEYALDDMRERIRQLQSKGSGEIQGTWRAGKRPVISLELEDLYLPEEPVVFHASVGDSVVPGLIARIESAVSKTEHPFVATDLGWTLRLEGLPPGLYRVLVRSATGGETQPTPVRDLFEMAAA